MSQVSLTDVTKILERVQTLVHNLDGLEIQDYTQGVKKAELAALTRQLLVAADSLELASGLIRNQYWMTKGYDDALERG